jgi:hypothetical protein
MKFLSVFKYDPSTQTGPPTEEDMSRMGRLIGEMSAAGVLVDTGGVEPTGTSMRVRRSGTNTSVTDGPFTESKEVVGGFAVLNVSSREEALTWTNRFLDCATDGVCELIEVTGPS